ncbi:hypothetical protein ACIQVL_25650 [Streptomyces sp. NPDC090499]|uniref:hypothetical protein n=1 Tax=Streptomyces sp. NPDC090499 TaxID=3365965 RepID=UPI0038306B74
MSEQSVNPETTAPETAAPEPAAAEPAVPEPVVSEAVVSKLAAAEPVVSEPVVSELAAAEPVVFEPVVSELAAAEPVVFEPVVFEPVVSEPAAPEPAAAEPAVPEPVVSEAVVSELAATEPVVSEPAVPEPAAAEPAVPEPVVSELAATEPVVSEPAASESAASEPAVSEAAADVPLSAPAAAVPAARSRRRVGVLVTAGVLAAAVVAGAAYTVVTVHSADRDPGAPVWSLPKDSKSVRAAAETGLQGMLLPYDKDRYGRGPDLAGFGSDVRLTGAQATALRKESIQDLPRTQRRELDRQIDKNPVKGMVMRSYANTAGGEGDEYTMDIQLAQMANRATVRTIANAERELFDALDIFRKGPEIAGYKDSTSCFLSPAESGEKLDTMLCYGYVGDVLVSATTTAAKPLDTRSAADMLHAQLERIKDPGAAV